MNYTTDSNHDSTHFKAYKTANLKNSNKTEVGMKWLIRFSRFERDILVFKKHREWNSLMRCLSWQQPSTCKLERKALKNRKSRTTAKQRRVHFGLYMTFYFVDETFKSVYETNQFNFARLGSLLKENWLIRRETIILQINSCWYLGVGTLLKWPPIYFTQRVEILYKMPENLYKLGSK